MNDWVQRKPVRLQGYDYSRAGYYFVTICAAMRKENIFAEIHLTSQTVGAAALGGPSPVSAEGFDHPYAGLEAFDRLNVTLTPAGKIVKQHIENINNVYNGQAGIDCYTIMPDHIHIVVWIRTLGSGPPRAAAPTVTLPGIVNALKGLSSKKLGYSIWQRGYYEHIIRGEADLQNIRQYVLSNPLKWTSDKE